MIYYLSLKQLFEQKFREKVKPPRKKKSFLLLNICFFSLRLFAIFIEIVGKKN